MVSSAVEAVPFGRSAEAINATSTAQGDLIWKLNSEKAVQPESDEASSPAVAETAKGLNDGDLVKKLEFEKAPQFEIEEGVKKLLPLKASLIKEVKDELA